MMEPAASTPDLQAENQHGALPWSLFSFIGPSEVPHEPWSKLLIQELYRLPYKGSENIFLISATYNRDKELKL